jgi:hypothetical protein
MRLGGIPLAMPPVSQVSEMVANLWMISVIYGLPQAILMALVKTAIGAGRAR